MDSIDLAAHTSARRLGTAALSVGVVYWIAVVRYSQFPFSFQVVIEADSVAFFTDAGWDMMEPVTWTTGFAVLLCGTGFLIVRIDFTAP